MLAKAQEANSTGLSVVRIKQKNPLEPSASPPPVFPQFEPLQHVPKRKEPVEPVSEADCKVSDPRGLRSHLCLPALPNRRLEGLTCLSAATIAVLCVVLVGYGMCFSLFAPFFPNEAAHKGMDSMTVGFVFGCFEFIIFIGVPLASRAVSARLFGLRFALGAGMLLAGGGLITFGLVDKSPNGTIYIVLCFVIRVVEGIGAALYLTAAYTVVGNVFSKNIAFVYSLMETSNSAGIVLGPSVGGFLYAAGGFSLPFITIGITVVVFGMISAIFLPLSAAQHEAVDAAQPGAKSVAWSRLFKSSLIVWIVCTVQVMAAVVSSYPEPTLSVYLEELGLTHPAMIGVVFFASAAVYVVTCVIIGRISDKFPDNIYSIMAMGGLFSSFCFLAMGPPPIMEAIVPRSFIMTSIAQSLVHAGIALVLVPIPRALLNSAMTAGYGSGLQTSAMISGIFNGLWSMGTFCGTPLAGFLVQTVGFQWGATIMAGISFAVFVILAPVAVAKSPRGEVRDYESVCAKRLSLPSVKVTFASTPYGACEPEIQGQSPVSIAISEVPTCNTDSPRQDDGHNQEFNVFENSLNYN